MLGVMRRIICGFGCGSVAVLALFLLGPVAQSRMCNAFRVRSGARFLLRASPGCVTLGSSPPE